MSKFPFNLQLNRLLSKNTTALKKILVSIVNMAIKKIKAADTTSRNAVKAKPIGYENGKSMKKSFSGGQNAVSKSGKTGSSYSRRSFLSLGLRSLSLLIASLKIPASLHALAKAKLVDEDVFAMDEQKQETVEKTEKFVTDEKWRLAYLGGEKEVYDGGFLTVLGKMPQGGISGYLYRAGSAGLVSRSRRANHPYEGEALAQVIRIKNRSIGHYGRVAQTKQYRQEKEENSQIFSRYATLGKSANTPYYQPPNMNVLAIEKTVYLLGDNVFPQAIDRQALSLSEGNFQAQKTEEFTKKKKITDFRFSSHPIQTERGIWNAVPVWGEKNGIQLTRFTQAGSLAKEVFHPLEEIGYFHSFLLTQKHVVVVMPPYLRKSPMTEKQTEKDSWQWAAQEPTRIFVFKIDTLQLQKQFAVDSFYCQHYSNAYDGEKKEAGKILFDGFAYDNPQEIENQQLGIANNQWRPAFAKHMHYSLDLTSGEFESRQLGSKNNNYEFPSIDPRQRSKKHTMVVALKRTTKDTIVGKHASFRRLVVRNPKTGGEVGYKFFNPNEIIEEHVYIPNKRLKPGTGGWIVGTSYDVNINRTILNIFEKDSIAKGPLIRSFLPYGVPFSMHGSFYADF